MHRFIPFLAAAAVSLFIAGAAAGSACDGRYCDPDMTGCDVMNMVVYDDCCRDSDRDGVFHCITCQRHLFICWVGGSPSTQAGPAFSCANPTEQCR